MPPRSIKHLALLYPANPRCQVKGGVILAVEYKGADRWEGAEDDRLIGDLWEELSGGSCRFVMARDKNWATIDAKL